MPDKPLPDVIAPDLDILFCGINPSLMSAERGHHFARPGNRFWPAIHLAGLTPRLFTPDEDRELLTHGLGITNVVARPTRAAAELTPEEVRERSGCAGRTGGGVPAAGAGRPRRDGLADGFGRPRAVVGRQPERVGGADTWVVPNPSGLNAHVQVADLARIYRQLRP